MMRRLATLSLVLAAASCDAVDTPPAAVQAIEPRSDPIERVRTLQPGRTRAGHLRFGQAELEDPDAAAVLLERLGSDDENAEVRAALAQALPRTGGDWGPAVVELLAHEADAEVRAAIVVSLRRAPADSAVAGLRLGLGDADARVRHQAAVVAGFVPAAVALEAELRRTLVVTEPLARAAAARSLGVLGARESLASVAAASRDPDARVRLEVVQALARLDPVRGAALVRALLQDPDPPVAAAAARVVSAAR